MLGVGAMWRGTDCAEPDGGCRSRARGTDHWRRLSPGLWRASCGGARYRSRPRSGLAAPINTLRDPRALLAPRQDASLRRLDPSLGHPTCRRGLRRPLSEGGRSRDRLVARGRRGGGGRRTRGRGTPHESVLPHGPNGAPPVRDSQVGRERRRLYRRAEAPRRPPSGTPLRRA